MRWKLPLAILGAGGVAAGALLYAFRRRNHLVIYSVDPQDSAIDRGTFRDAARLAARALHTTAHPVSSATDLIRVLRQAPGNLGMVLFVGHGTSRRFLSPARFGIDRDGTTRLPRWISEEDFATLLASKLARGFVVAFAGCSAARGPGEPRGWTVATGWHGGADSLAGYTRDALVRAGAPKGKVIGHTVQGSTLDNPQGREFSTRSPGRAGVHIMALAGRAGPPDFTAYRAWNTYAQGRKAVNWILGGSIRG